MYHLHDKFVENLLNSNFIAAQYVTVPFALFKGKARYMNYELHGILILFSEMTHDFIKQQLIRAQEGEALLKLATDPPSYLLQVAGSITGPLCKGGHPSIM